MRMIKYSLILIAAFLLASCTSPIQMNQIEAVHLGMSPLTVTRLVDRQPDKVVHVRYHGNHYVAQVYPMEVGTQTDYSTSCGKYGCTTMPYTVPVSSSYLFIYRGSDHRGYHLINWGFVSDLSRPRSGLSRQLMHRIKIAGGLK